MKNITFIMVIIIGIFIFLGVLFIENILLGVGKDTDTQTINVKFFTKEDCNECTQLDEYLEVYKKAGVIFGNISIKKYGGEEYNAHLGEYNIKKLPFIVFSKNLENYTTISDSWKTTFGYKNDDGEFIPTDIIPPYFDIEKQKVEGLIDITYIGSINCKDCYTLDEAKNILSEFGLQFRLSKKLNNTSQEARDIITQYKIKNFPTVILSSQTSAYENFSSFWINIGSIEENGKYILRNPIPIGLKLEK